MHYLIYISDISCYTKSRYQSQSPLCHLEKKDLVIHDKNEAGALTHLISYLSRLEDLTSAKEKEYYIAGRTKPIPEKLPIRLDMERRFVLEYEKLLYIIFLYFDLYKKYSDKVAESIGNFDDLKVTSRTLMLLDGIVKNNSSLFRSSILQSYKELTLMYVDLKPEIRSKDHNQNVIVNSTNLAIRVRNEILPNFIHIVEHILTSKKSTVPLDRKPLTGR
jgi:hypothetical protein